MRRNSLKVPKMNEKTLRPFLEALSRRVVLVAVDAGEGPVDEQLVLAAVDVRLQIPFGRRDVGALRRRRAVQ